MEPKGTEFPFKCVLSLSPLVTFWKGKLSDGDPIQRAIAKKIREELKNAPDLLEPIEDLSILGKHKGLVEMLMSVVFPPAFWDKDYAAALVPFHFEAFYATPLFKRVLVPGFQNFGRRANNDKGTWAWGKLLKAYLHILREFYGMDLVFEYPLIVTASDPETGLDRYFQIDMGTQFLEIRKVGRLKPLSKEAKKRLLANVTDPGVWMDLIPPGRFEFHGFSVVRAVDVTDQEVLSSLKRDLIEKESIFSKNGFNRLQEKLRTFLRQPELMLGLTATQADRLLILSPQYELDKGCIFSDSHRCRKCEVEGSVFAQAMEKGEPLVVDDLQTHPGRTSVEEELIQAGVRSLFVTPLYYQGRLLGTLVLKSPQRGGLSLMKTMKLQKILPLFSMALNRSMEELHHRVEAVIKEKCTAIHPSVEWRFQKAALNFIEKQQEGVALEFEPIVFRNVYPLYGMSDIRGSSEKRNSAIQADLIDHLRLAGDVVRCARKRRSLPFLDALAYQIDKNISRIARGLVSGDEVTSLGFLRREVEPFFGQLQEFGPDVSERIDAYRRALDPHVGTLYRQRRDFEESVTAVTETISTYLDQEQKSAQAVFPHYFEKQKTDGVDHTIYLGASMVEDGKFDLLYLRNLRLWQLIVLCGAAWETERLKGTLKMPLETAHLILVQDTPLSIRFRPDERRFDVDGAYDIRHEIIKKRIDKAIIRGRSERLTQPGKIAIVYSNSREAQEYGEYIDYLHASGYLTGDIEDLELESLQGVHGLKALRVTVDMQASVLEQRVAPEVLQEAVKAMPQSAS